MEELLILLLLAEWTPNVGGLYRAWIIAKRQDYGGLQSTAAASFEPSVSTLATVRAGFCWHRGTLRAYLRRMSSQEICIGVNRLHRFRSRPRGPSLLRANCVLTMSTVHDSPQVLGCSWACGGSVRQYAPHVESENLHRFPETSARRQGNRPGQPHIRESRKNRLVFSGPK